MSQVVKLKQEVLIDFDPEEVVVVEGRNTRFDYGNLEDLAASIKENGVRNPIKVKQNGNAVELVEGHRRVEAAKLVKQHYADTGEQPLIKDGRLVYKLPARVLSNDISEQEITVEMLVSNDGKPFLPMEEALLLKRLKDTGISAAEIGRRIGRSTAHVTNRLSLVSAAPSVKEAINSGEITVSDAVSIVRAAPTAEEQEEIVTQVKEKGKNEVIRRGLERGRIPRHQMEVVERIYQQFNAAWSDAENSLRHETDTAFNAKVLQRVIGEIEAVPTLDLAFQLGKLSGAADLTSLQLPELLSRISYLVTGALENYEV